MTDFDFVEAWNGKQTLDELVLTMNKSRVSIKSRASRLRKKGYRLQYRYPSRDHYQKIGAIGGRKSRGGGFADRELARRAGAIGGKLNKRGKNIQ